MRGRSISIPGTSPPTTRRPSSTSRLHSGYCGATASPPTPAEAEREIERWLAGAATTPAAGWTRGELETPVREEHSTFAWLLGPLLTHAGFEILERDLGGRIYATYVCRRS
jgi:hypothetical protein